MVPGLTHTDLKFQKLFCECADLTSLVAMVSNTHIIKIVLRCCFVPQVDFLLKCIASFVQSVIHLCCYNQMVKSSHLAIFKRKFKNYSRKKKGFFFLIHS